MLESLFPCPVFRTWRRQIKHGSRVMILKRSPDRRAHCLGCYGARNTPRKAHCALSALQCSLIPRGERGGGNFYLKDFVRKRICVPYRCEMAYTCRLLGIWWIIRGFFFTVRVIRLGGLIFSFCALSSVTQFLINHVDLQYCTLVCMRQT